MCNNTIATLFSALTIIFAAAGRGGIAHSKSHSATAVVISILLSLISAFMAGYYLIPKLKNK